MPSSPLVLQSGAQTFSEYVVVNTKTVSETTDTGDNAVLAPFALLLALSFAGMAVMVAGKKELQ